MSVTKEPQVTVSDNLTAVGLEDFELHATFTPKPGIPLKVIDQTTRDVRALLALAATDMRLHLEATQHNPTRPRR